MGRPRDDIVISPEVEGAADLGLTGGRGGHRARERVVSRSGKRRLGGRVARAAAARETNRRRRKGRTATSRGFGFIPTPATIAASIGLQATAAAASIGVALGGTGLPAEYWIQSIQKNTTVGAHADDALATKTALRRLQMHGDMMRGIAIEGNADHLKHLVDYYKKRDLERRQGLRDVLLTKDKEGQATFATEGLMELLVKQAKERGESWFNTWQGWGTVQKAAELMRKLRGG